ncbi:AraC family transcriptional regulator [Dyadobacter sp. CY312]|uniref:helix-turn-helix domain-containing protein n=1 Tax=Dyadobacter sp. CY312 TaxID=2907303 RepID=UPI001F32656F|nr:helix-turn-helix domain-containing protein [Dyadobacter sp. CY312]MCE7043270.1 helix-turn-helix domain-containing protein [Dyadobacter sp. CY312]
MSDQYIFFFSALGSFNGLLISGYFAYMAQKKVFSNYFLSLLFFVLSIRVIKSVFFYFNPDLANIFIQIGLSACVLIGPFLYLYLKSNSENSKTNWQIHIIPYIAGISIAGIFYPYVDHRPEWSKWFVSAIYFQWITYILLSFKYILPIIIKFRTKEDIKKIDIWYLSIYFGTFIIWLAYYTSSYTSYIVGGLSFTFVLYLMILLLIFKNSKETSFFQEKEKYKNKDIDTDTLNLIDERISIIFKKELYLNPNITLDEAAKEMNVTRHLLSQYLNVVMGKSFSNLINEHRVERAKTLLTTENNLTVESIGYDSGFNSKSTFFTTFKKFTGKTPSEYQKILTK